MDKKSFKILISNYNINLIERAIIFHYLKINQIDYSKSEFINSYLGSYETSNSLEILINKLNISTIKDLENSLELLIPETDRKINGAFFTPDYIVDYIINEISPKENDTNIDPSCGCGAFLIGLVRYYSKKYNKSIKSIIKENIFGADILNYNIERTKLILTIYALQKNEILLNVDFNLYCVDSLRFSWDRSFNNVVGNPPYVKFQDLCHETRSYLASSWKTTINGTYNLFFAFFELGYKLLSTGKLGYITPNNYFTSLAAEPLRVFFKDKKCVNKIVDFNSSKVFEVQTYTAITFLSKLRTESIKYDKLNTNISTNDFLKKLSFSNNQIDLLNNKKWRLLRNNERSNIYKIENIGEPIKYLFDICVGVATLKDTVFFVDGNSFDGDYFYKKASNDRIYKIEKEIVQSVYKISDFKSQNEIKNNSRKIICPYIVNNNHYNLIDENTLKSKYKYCYEYLQAEKHILMSRDKGKLINSPFYAWGRTQGISKFGIKLLTPTFSKTPRFLKVDEFNSYFTNGYGIFCKNNIGNLFDNDNLVSRAENFDIVQKILNSAIMDYYINCTSVSIDGGYPCYQKNFIEKFSIPEFTIDDIYTMRSLKTRNDIDNFLVLKYGLDFN